MKRDVIILVIIGLFISSCSILKKKDKSAILKQDSVVVYAYDKAVVLEHSTAGDSPELILEEKVLMLNMYVI